MKGETTDLSLHSSYYSMMYFQHVSVDIWRLASSIVSMLQVGYFEGKSTIPLMREGHDSSGTCLLQVNQLFFKNSEDGANTTHMSALVCVSVCVSTALRHHRLRGGSYLVIPVSS